MRRLLPCWGGVLVVVAACGCQASRCCCSGCATSTGCNCLSKCGCGTCNSSRANATSQGLAASSIPSKFVPTSPMKTKTPANSAVSLPTDIRSRVSSSSYAPTTVAPEEREQFVSASIPEATTAGTPNSNVSTEPRYGHDAEYHRLIGVLDYSRIQDAWVLRYVSYEDDDRYGGSVTLVAPGNMTQFKAGQTVRVEGDLIDPESRQLRPAFQVRSIRAEL
jgi:hypothetical protein